MGIYGLRAEHLRQRARGAALRRRIIAGGGSCGPGLTAEPGVRLRYGAQPGLVIGTGVHLGTGVILEVTPTARLDIGDRVRLMHYTVVAAAGHITIGPDSQTAEMCSVRDSEHGMSREKPMRDQDRIAECHIGADVWIGRGAAVLAGSNVADGCVVGANSVLRATTEPYTIWVGAPARMLRRR